MKGLMISNIGLAACLCVIIALTESERSKLSEERKVLANSGPNRVIKDNKRLLDSNAELIATTKLILQKIDSLSALKPMTITDTMYVTLRDTLVLGTDGKTVFPSVVCEGCEKSFTFKSEEIKVSFSGRSVKCPYCLKHKRLK